MLMNYQKTTEKALFTVAFNVQQLFLITLFLCFYRPQKCTLCIYSVMDVLEIFNDDDDDNYTCISMYL